MARPLRRQIVITMGVLALVGYPAIFYGARLTYHEHVRQLMAETSTTAATVAVYVNRNIEYAAAIATTASRHPLMWAADPRAGAGVLQPLVGRGDGVWHNALLTDPAGQPVAWARPVDPAIEGTLDPAFMRGVAERRQMAISPMLGQGGGAHTIVLAYPVVDGTDRVVGVVGLSLRLESLDEILSSIPLPPSSVVTLFDAQSVIMARSLASHRYIGQAVVGPGEARDPSAVPPSEIRRGIDGVERVFGYAVVARGPWLASVGIPVTVAWSRTLPIYYRNFAISIGTTIVVFALVLFVGRRWLKAFADLDQTATRVSRGDLSPLEPRPMPTAEMERLQQTIAGMITNLQHARQSIAAQVDDERRMREELQSLQQQVIRQERLAAIGVLVSGVAHELNNPLQAILGFSELLQMQQDMPASARADLTLIQKESARASAIIRNLSRFGRQLSEPTPVQLHAVVQSVMELRHRKLEELNIKVELHEQSAAPVMAIFTELQQVLLNFAINAEQAIVQGQGDRRMIIRTGDRDGWAWIELEDSGPGVAAEDEAKLFQPFHTTKPVGEGTGLGLSVSYDIIRAYGGRIGYRRAAAGGAVFFFELPVVPADEPTTR